MSNFCSSLHWDELSWLIQQFTTDEMRQVQMIQQQDITENQPNRQSSTTASHHALAPLFPLIEMTHLRPPILYSLYYAGMKTVEMVAKAEIEQSQLNGDIVRRGEERRGKDGSEEKRREEKRREKGLMRK